MTVDFGFKNIDPSEKTKKVFDVFKNVASKYDVMNDVMSGGVHRLWKREFVAALPFRGQSVYLDVAGGTGDIATLIWNKLQRRGMTSSRVVVCDINEHMMQEGRKKSPGGIEWSAGNAESLPMPDASVDVYTISFGLRNVTDKEKALREACRVLKPGGYFYCLEFSEVCKPLSPFYDLYSFQFVPRMGQLVANDRESYQYLVESIRRFPNQESLKRMMEEAGFERVRYRNFMGGIAAMHEGQKPL